MSFKKVLLLALGVACVLVGVLFPSPGPAIAALLALSGVSLLFCSRDSW